MLYRSSNTEKAQQSILAFSSSYTSGTIDKHAAQVCALQSSGFKILSFANGNEK